MKKILHTLLATTLLAACGSDNTNSVANTIATSDIETIRTKHAEIAQQRKALENDLNALDAAMALLDDNAKLPLVTTLTATPQTFKHYIELQGDLEIGQDELVYPEISGILTHIHVEEDQKVTKGQVLATIDDGGLSDQLAQAKIQANLSQTTFERQKRLWEQNIGSEMQYLQAKAQYEAQQNVVKQLQSQLDKATIKSPFTGIVDDVVQDPGTLTNPGSELFRIINASELSIAIEVPETHLATVTLGKPVTVYFPVLGQSATSHISDVGTFINLTNRCFTADIPVPTDIPNIKPNLTAKVKINDYTNPNAILIPQSIISENADGQQYVYRIQNQPNTAQPTAQKVRIQTGKTQGDYVEVLAGINSGDQIINEGGRTVKQGQKVRLKNTLPLETQTNLLQPIDKDTQP